MGFFYDEDAARALFRLEVEQRLEEARTSWSRFADTRRMRYGARGTNALPAIEGRVDGANVLVSAVGKIDWGYRTRATTNANIPLRGKLRVKPPGDWDELLGVLRKPRFFGDPELDRLLVVKTSSEGLARTVLDKRVLETVRALAPGRLELAYVEGAITLEWGGVERNHATLDDVMQVLAYIAVKGNEETPYR